MSSRTGYEELIPKFLLDAEITPPCAEADPDAFFPLEEPESTSPARHRPSHVYANEKAAKAVCEQCPLRVECLVFAIKTGQMGIWGGTTENERRNLHRKYR
jgi:WhiB family redox-sensing transcriptional regulator